ncbi:MAG: domain S-box protein, partial [Mucilaginibacter sp.]|nr:domain S-box protein [Mucilaginibacter sp.]
MYKSSKNITIIVIAWLTIVAGITVMAGWVLNIPILQSVIPGFIAMKFNPALCFVLFGSALLFTQYKELKFSTPFFFILSGFGTLIGIITLCQELLHLNTGIDQLFITDKTPVSANFPMPGRMAFNSSISFMLLGFGFLALSAKSRLFSIISQCLFQIVIILSAIALIGYLYGSALFNALFFVTTMAKHTAILFFILSLAASLLNPSIGITRLFTGTQVGNQMARRLYTLMLAIVVLVGAFRIQIQSQQFPLISFETAVSLLAIGFLIISLLLIWNTANWLNKIDTQRSEAEEKIKLMNAGLEKIVEERSAEFQKSEEKYRSLIEQASDAIYILDLNGSFTDVNASMCKMMGYSREELLRLNIESIVDPAELKTDPLSKKMDSAKASVIRERRFVSKNGKIFTVEVNVKKFADRIMVIARDITGRKKMESELKEAEVKFRTIAEKSMVGVYIVQNGRFVYVNPRFAQIFGYMPAELINTVPVETVINQSHQLIATGHVKRRMEGEVESVNYEAIGQKKDGTSNWVEFYGNRAIIGGEPTIIGSMIDISERKKTEEELRSSEQKYKLLFDSNPMPMWMITKDDQTVLAVNDAAAKHYGYAKDELLNMDAKALRPKEDLDQQLETYRQEVSSNSARIVKHLKKDGTIMFVHIISYDIIFEGRPVRLSMTNDITEKLNAEESLQKSEANLQAILKTTDTAYALFDKNLRLLAFNQKAVEFVKGKHGYTPSKGDKLRDYFPKDKFPAINNFAKDVLKGNNISYEVDYQREDGSVVWYYERLFPITNDNKQIIGMLMALYDITERKNAEQDLKSAYERIQNHINSIKDMAWKQSHLIRSPLANL